MNFAMPTKFFHLNLLEELKGNNVESQLYKFCHISNARYIVIRHMAFSYSVL